MNIPINAEVLCADGSYGRSTCVILNPTTEQVTHVVVKEAVFGIERMVPVDLVEEATSTQIRLDSSRNELERMPPMTITEYLKPMTPFDKYNVDQYVMLPYAASSIPPIQLDHDMVPPDELAIRRGTRVEATDGSVGRVSEFVVNRGNGQISHLILEEGPFWSKKDVAVPLAQIDRIEQDVVYLKLDKQAIAALPTIPLHRGLPSKP